MRGQPILSCTLCRVYRGQHGLSCVSCVFGAHTQRTAWPAVCTRGTQVVLFCNVWVSFLCILLVLLSDSHVPPSLPHTFCSACTSTWMLGVTLSAQLVLGPELSAVLSSYVHLFGISVCFLQRIDSCVSFYIFSSALFVIFLGCLRYVKVISLDQNLGHREL